jgi:flagellar assembly protein FliH
MTNSSPEAAGTAVLGSQGSDTSGTVRALSFAHRELRSGDWTRLGGAAVLGDAVTEHALGALAADARAAARAQGYATGWAEGRRAADEQAQAAELTAVEVRRLEDERRESEHRAAVQALLDAAAKLDESVAETCARVETHAVRLAAQLTEALVGHELAVAKNPGLGAVRRALALLPGEPVTRIRVAPEEAADPGLAELAGTVVVVADATLGRGDALVETEVAVVDARVSTALHRVLEVLA